MGIKIKDLVEKQISANDYVIVDAEEGTYKSPAEPLVDNLKKDMSNIDAAGVNKLKQIVGEEYLKASVFEALGLSVVNGQTCITYEKGE